MIIAKGIRTPGAAARAVKRIKGRVFEDLAIIPEDEWEEISELKADNQRLQECILGMIEGKSPCEWCEDQRECGGNGAGCSDWWLSWPR